MPSLSRTELLKMKEDCQKELTRNDIDESRKKALEDEINSINFKLEQYNYNECECLKNSIVKIVSAG